MVTQLNSREIAPPGHRRWAQESEDLHATLDRRFSKWLGAVADSEKLFSVHVYSNQESTPLDFRQHRQALYQLLFIGEEMALDFISGLPLEAKTYVPLIDQKLQALQTALFEWHGPVEPDSVPDSFKESFAQAKAGELMDLEFPE